MLVEKKAIEGHIGNKGVYGHITLENLAKPESVTVIVDSVRMYPESFDIFGHPNFTVEQESLFRYKQQDMYRKKGKEFRLLAEIHYEKATFNVPRQYFDTLGGIQDSLDSLDSLNAMLNYRRIYKKVNPDIKLNEFMLLGCFYLDTFGQVMSIEKHAKNTLISNNTVEYFSEFSLKNNSFMLTLGGFAIPENNSICPCCGMPFIIKDILENPCIQVEGKYYHDACYSKYERLREIDKFTRSLMDMVYKFEDYTFETVPNGYCNQPCCSNIPWILFHTPDGDIEIGNRKRVISIEWKENYKNFDFDLLFEKEDVTKWKEKGKCGIHAWSENKCFEYLNTVVHAVNPEYNIWK